MKAGVGRGLFRACLFDNLCWVSTFRAVSGHSLACRCLVSCGPSRKQEPYKHGAALESPCLVMLQEAGWEEGEGSTRDEAIEMGFDLLPLLPHCSCTAAFEAPLKMFMVSLPCMGGEHKRRGVSKCKAGLE